MGDRNKFPHAVDLFNYWTSGSDNHHIAMDPPKKGEPCEAFHVALRGDAWIPVSLLVFARDAEHARSRVEETLRECHKRGEPYRLKKDEGESRGAMLLHRLDAGELTWHVEPYDTNRLAASINWASNGGTGF